MKQILFPILFCAAAMLCGRPYVAVLPVECSEERVSKDNLYGVRKIVESNLEQSGWRLMRGSKSRAVAKRYLASATREEYCAICKDESLDGLVMTRLYAQMGSFFLEITMPDKDSGIADEERRYVMQLTGVLNPDSVLHGLSERLLGEKIERAMIALFGTVSMVPTMPYKSYLACYDALSSEILSRSCRVLGKKEAEEALRRNGVVRICDLTPKQAAELSEELKCAALVQLMVTKYNLQEGRQISRRKDRRNPSGQPFLIAEVGGEIQVWGGTFGKPMVIPFRRIVNSDEVDACGEDGRIDRNLFGQAALRAGLEQAMRNFRR